MRCILNNEGVASPVGRLWSNSRVHAILTNEVYTGTLVWGTTARDEADPVRVDKAFSAIVSKAHFRRVNSLMRSRAPKFSHSRRVGSSFLLSGLAKCKTCNTPLTGQFAKSGQYTYVCQTIIKRGKDDCNIPRLNARRFEQLIVSRIRSSILTEGNVGDLTKVAVQELNGLAQEQRRRLESIESELAEVRRRLDRLWDLVETTDYYDPADTALQIKAHSERKRALEASAAEATTVYQRRAVRDDVEAITAQAKDMTEFLKESELPERRAFIELFVKEIVVSSGKAVVRYMIPMPQDSRIAGMDAEEVDLPGPTLSADQRTIV